MANKRPGQNLPPPTRILEYIKRHLCYDPVTGKIIRKKKVIGSRNKNRGICIVLLLPNEDGTITMYNTYAHRIAWYLTYHAWPNKVSHIDGDVFNNRIDNLRIFDMSTIDKSWIKKTSHYTLGISWCSDGSKHWRVYITVDNKRMYLGRFETEEDAAAAYNEKAAQLGKPLTQLIQTHDVPLNTSQTKKEDKVDY